MAACSIQIQWIDSLVPVGGLYPTHIRVAVTLANCSGGDAIVRTDHTGQSPATPVSLGGHVFELAVTKAVNCDDIIHVEAWCATDPNCLDVKDFPLPCTQCVRAQVSSTAGQCTGNPPVQPVTLKAEIGLAPGQSTNFFLDFGDGSFGNQFTITNITNTAQTIYTHVEPPHNYSPGVYTAKLTVVPPPYECGPFPLPITVQCPPSCPSASNASWAEKDCVVVAGQGKKRRIELSVTVTPTPAVSTAQWILRKIMSGGMLGAPINGPTFGCPGNNPPQPVGPGQQMPPGPHTMDLDPGDYEASLQFLYPFQTCPGLTFNLTADACPPDCPDMQLAAPVVTGCAPTNAVAVFNATLSWRPGQLAVPVSDYLWTVEWLDQSVSPPVQKKAQNSSAGPTLTPSIKTNDPGWSGNGAIGSLVDLSKPGSYTVSVQALIPGVSPTTGCNVLISSVPPFPVPPCTCPKPMSTGTEWTVSSTTAPLGPNRFQTLSCDSAAVQLSLFVDPGSYSPGDLTYDWSFPNGTSVIGSVSTQFYTFNNAQPGVTQMHTVTVTVRVPGSSCAPFTRAVDVIVPGCTPGVPPSVTGCSVQAGSSGSGSVSVKFDQDVDRASAEDSANYRVRINNGTPFTPVSGSIFYDSTSKTATISGLTINPGDTVEVTVTGIKNQTGAVMTTPGRTNCSAPGRSSSGLCDTLLWVAMALIGIGAFLVLLGCILTQWVAQAGAVLGIIGWILIALGWLLFILWLIFCRLTTLCTVILAVRSFVGWLIGVFALITIILGIIGYFYPSFQACFWLAFVLGLDWGLIYWIINLVAQARGCLIENPGG